MIRMFVKKGFFVTATALLLACNGGTNQVDKDSGPKDRHRDVNEAITHSTRIANDSVVIPGTGNTGGDPSRTDTSKK